MADQHRTRVAALYKFVPISDCASLQRRLATVCRRNAVLGTLILAEEGINGTIAGPAPGIAAVVDFLRSMPAMADLQANESWCDANPFHRMKVRLKREIVTMGVAGVDPPRQAGCHVEPRQWNRLLADPETLVIDTRNTYETAIGRFRDALDPATENFRNFPGWVEENRDILERAGKIAMYCTGGIRCEKATAYLKSQGFTDVFHLKGGILAYLEQIDAADSVWEGECFVFDNRVSLRHGLVAGNYRLCHACRHPVSQEDLVSPHYREGISCPHCHDRISEADRQRFVARQQQISLAKARGEPHIAADFNEAKQRKRRRRAAADATGSVPSKLD